MATDQRLGIDVEINAEIGRLEKNLKRAGRVVESSTSDMDKTTKRAARSFEQLEGKLDPASRALQRYQRDSERVRRALDKGAVSSERAAQVQRRLNDQYEQATVSARQLDSAQDRLAANTTVYGRTATTATARTSRFGGAAQNASFQIADFATQVSSGQSATRALSQQLPQLLGGFGVFGAVIGGAVAVAGALAPALFRIGENTDTADDATRTYGESLEEVNRIVDAANDKSATRAQRLRDEGQAALEGARKEVQAAEAKLEALRGGGTGLAGLLNDALDSGGASPSNPRLDRARRNGEPSGLATFLEDMLGLNGGGDSDPTLDPRSRRGLDRRVEAAQQELEKRAERLQELREKLDTAISEGDGGGSSASEAGGGTADTDRFGIPKQTTLDRLEEQIRLQKMSARERAQARAVMQAQNEAMKEGNLLAQDEVSQIRETAGTLGDLREGVRVQ
mgnify:CR=1 FL=1